MLHRDNVESFEYITLNELTKRNLIFKSCCSCGYRTIVEVIQVHMYLNCQRSQKDHTVPHSGAFLG